MNPRTGRLERIRRTAKGVLDRKAKAMTQLGTLGGGNHFIEVCLIQKTSSG
jgi:RNA-splicing ligase RtcB